MTYKVYPLRQWPELYLDWINNFLTIDKFAEHYGMSDYYAKTVIAQGNYTDNFTINL